MAGNSHSARLYGGVKAFSCPNCGGQVAIRAPGQTLSCACIHCGTLIDISDENFRIISKAKKRSRKLLIPLGTRGHLQDIEWEVIGYMERKAVGYDYVWEEYLLFNPIHGFGWLMNAYGHWTLYRGIMDKPDYQKAKKQAVLDGETYKAFTSGEAEVRYVLGEFYWYVKRGDKTRTSDLIRPPFILSAEWDDAGIFWSKGEYLQPKIIREAFGITRSMPPRKGVGANQPNRARERFMGVLPIWIATLVIMAVLQIIFSSNSANEVVRQDTFLLTKADTTVVSDTFAIKGGTGNVEVGISTQIDNDWFETEASLYRIDDGTDRGFKLTAEYYHGVTDGESWSEGGQNSNIILNNIPEGKYQLILNVYTNPLRYASKDSSQSFTVQILRDVQFGSNFFFLALIFSLLPGALFFISHRFEKKRWEDA